LSADLLGETTVFVQIPSLDREETLDTKGHKGKGEEGGNGEGIRGEEKGKILFSHCQPYFTS